MFWNFVGIAAALMLAALLVDREDRRGASAFLAFGAISFVGLAAVV